MGNEFEAWKDHFSKQARGLIPHEDKFYKVSEVGKGEEVTPLKLVSPTQEVLERAKSTLTAPPTIYDPVTGVTHQSEQKPRRVRRSSMRAPGKTRGRKSRKQNFKKTAGKGGRKTKSRKSSSKKSLKNKTKRKSRKTLW